MLNMKSTYVTGVDSSSFSTYSTNPAAQPDMIRSSNQLQQTQRLPIIAAGQFDDTEVEEGRSQQTAECPVILLAGSHDQTPTNMCTLPLSPAPSITLSSTSMSTRPTEWDIVVSRSRDDNDVFEIDGSAEFQGNKARFHKFLKETYHKEYAQVRSDLVRSFMAETIVMSIRGWKPTCRVLAKEHINNNKADDDSEWFDIGDDCAKVCVLQELDRIFGGNSSSNSNKEKARSALMMKKKMVKRMKNRVVPPVKKRTVSHLHDARSTTDHNNADNGADDDADGRRMKKKQKVAQPLAYPSPLCLSETNTADVTLPVDLTELQLQRQGVSVESTNLYEKRWLERFNDLIEFKEKHGHCRVPQSYTPNSTLGNWVHNQRRLYRKVKTGEIVKSILTEERIEMMNNMGFEWALNRGSNNAPNTIQNWDRRNNSNTAATHDECWRGMFLELTMFKFENGHCDVSQVFGPSSRLCCWVIEQRRDYLNYIYGNATNMTSERVKELLSLGFPFPEKTVITPSSNMSNVSIEVRSSGNVIHTPADVHTSCVGMCLPLKKNISMSIVFFNKVYLNES